MRSKYVCNQQNDRYFIMSNNEHRFRLKNFSSIPWRPSSTQRSPSSTPELFFADIRELPPVEELERVADPSRLERSRRMRAEGARLRCLGAGWLLHRAFGSREYHRNEWGRPELVGGGPFFSLSHSGTKVMLLVSDSPCGCDIEERIASRPLERIAERFFHPAAFADFRRLGASPPLFYRLWTLGESYMKGVGKGFALSPRSFRHEVEPPHRLLESSEPGFEAWRFHVSEEIPGYTFAVTVRDR